ncbi:hypothetical protein [Nostoc sp. JL33]|uniref:hypothetical protein n=1 Tax=Nostoc sp. JL33 TaxID=2815396 RepID=UPI0025F947B0|nr:hypothetical protein [Nostoc sp. JL33]MBN3874205.1 hypothetical protein [Nostoc sp. JL33]
MQLILPQNKALSRESEDKQLPTAGFAYAILVLSTVICLSDRQIAASVSLGTDK